MDKVYMVQFNWSTTESDGIETELFDTYTKAHERFFEIILNECNPDMSWVGAEVFEINGIVNDGYIFDTNAYDTKQADLWWNVTDENDYNRHVFLELRKLEIK